MMVPFGPVMALMAVMAIKHFVADFLLQTAAMARGKAAAQGWLGPLLRHALTHALMTAVIALLIVPGLWWVAVVEFVVHAGIDRGKVLVGRTMRLDPSMPRFWWLLGFDQLLHQLTNAAIIGGFLMTMIAA